MSAKLTYFGSPSNSFRGLSEPIRAFAAASGFPLEFEQIDMAVWADAKPSFPYAALPVVTLADGTVLAQSAAILLLIAEEKGRNGKTPLDRAKVREVEGVFQDAAQGWTFADLTDEAKRQAAKEKIENLLNKLAARVGDEWAVGDDFTAADARIWGEVRRLSYLIEGLEVPAKLASIADKFEKLEAVQGHLETAPKDFVPRFFAEKNEYLQKRNAVYGL